MFNNCIASTMNSHVDVARPSSEHIPLTNFNSINEYCDFLNFFAKVNVR